MALSKFIGSIVAPLLRDALGRAMPALTSTPERSSVSEGYSRLMAERYYVYIYRDPRPGMDGQPIYVGKGTSALDRAGCHWRRECRNRFLSAVLVKIAQANLEPVIEIVMRTNEEADAFASEIELISRFGRRDLARGSLCNLTDGGEGVSGIIQTEEHRNKNRVAQIGRKQTPESIEKTRAAKLGRPLSLEHREKLRLAAVGRTASVEVRAKLSAAKKGRKFSQAHREKISAGLRGRVLSPESREKLSEANRGKTPTPETRAKLSAAGKGRRLTDEIRAKISAAKLGRKHSPESIEIMRMSHARRGSELIPVGGA